MRAAVAIGNLVLGLAYVGIGTVVLVEMKRGWRTLGFSHFAIAMAALAFTCGPHHLDHGLHLATGRAGGSLDLVTVAVGIPAGAGFVLLRLEAYLGGRGDRFLSGNPGWLLALPTLSGIYVTSLVFAGAQEARAGLRSAPMLPPNVLLAVIYAAIGVILLRNQLRNRALVGGWSVSGLSLAGVFLTCVPMHAVMSLYLATGRYDTDVHGLAIGWLAVPAGLYFLWVVQALYRGSISDWNESKTERTTRWASVR